MKMRSIVTGLCSSGALLIALGVGSLSLARAHPDIDVRIAAVDKRIAADPGNARLYLKRGELHREHRDWNAALSDYRKATKLDPELAAVHLARGLLFFDAGKLDRAKAALDRFVSLAPDHANGVLARARVLTALGERLAAAKDFDRGIAHASRPTPELYLERARVLAAAGNEHIQRALSGLDDGMEELGRIVTLQSYAIELELRGGNHQGALARLDQVARWLPQERFLQRQGEIYQHAGDEMAAEEAYRKALQRIDSFPPSKKGSQPITELRSRLVSSLAAVGSSRLASTAR